MSDSDPITTACAVRAMRSDPACRSLVADAYLDEDVIAAANRFARSAEFASVLQLLGDRLKGSCALDVGAGRGIASYALGRHGAAVVYALEPDPAIETGRAALEVLRRHIPADLYVLDGYGEKIPLADESVDVVYARQVLHHARSLRGLVSESARVLRKGGVFLACREHVIAKQRDLERFLHQHPLHHLTGTESAYRLDEYRAAIHDAGLALTHVLGPWDDVINAFPAVRERDALGRYAHDALVRHFGRLGSIATHVPGLVSLAWYWIRRPTPGDLYSFLAVKGG